MLSWILKRIKGRHDPATERPEDFDKKHELMCVQVVASRTSWPVVFVWLLLSFGVALSSICSFVQPEWFVREDTYSSDVSRSPLSYSRPDLLYTIGLFSVCYRDPPAVERTWQGLSCYQFGSDHELIFFPSTSWQISCVLFGAGCVLAVATSTFALGSIWLDDWRRRKSIVHVIGYVQAAGVVMQAVSLVLFPAVLSSHFARLHCGTRAGFFRSDACKLGWAYVLAIVSTVLGCYCPLLARFSFTQVYKDVFWTPV